jgi:hypothetical protein
MAKDYLNVIERALMMGISDKLNAAVTEDVFVFGEFPETEDLKFPAIIVQMVASGFDEQFFGQKTAFGENSSVGTGEIYGVSYLVHVLAEKESLLTIDGDEYKQRRLINWLMLNIANAVADIDWALYEEEELEILHRSLEAWRDIGFLTSFQWYGATAEFILHFKNYRT